ncbi:sensor histidine kinase [Reinekea marina]|uniref:histidine kinase n=2 Tax=Reinekea marina TaxID=1310421 RepID=A0ABV7WND4_9GAMM
MLSILIILQFGYARALARLTIATEQDVNHQLELQVQILESHLEKFRLLPVLMGQHGDKTKWIPSSSNLTQTESWLRQLNYISGAFDTLILNEQGHILASAQSLSRSMYSENVLKQLASSPLEAKLGRQHLTIEDNQSLYGFSSLYRLNNYPESILVFMVNLEPVAQSWAIATANLIATDSNNQIVMASDQQLIGKKLLKTEQLKETNHHVISHIDLHTLGWTVSAQSYIDKQSIIRFTLLSSLLICFIIIGIFTLITKRREKLLLIQQKEIQHAQELEHEIDVRTAELRNTNERLRKEVSERILTEQQLKTTQQELIHSAKLAAIGQMSTNLSHEYNQPLATMRTYAENGLKFLRLNKYEQAMDNFERIIQQTARLGDLSKTLMSFARKPSEKQSIVNMYACVEEAFMLVQPRVKSKKIILKHQVPKTAKVYGNAIQLSQVMLNLLSNAIDAVTDAQHHLSSPQVLVSFQITEAYIDISVEDSGDGIDSANRDSIFEPFFTSKKSGAGLGLGLSIVKDIIKSHGGKIVTRQSQLGGACFTISLPNNNHN